MIRRTRGTGGHRPSHATSPPWRTGAIGASHPTSHVRRRDEGAAVVEAAFAVPALLIVALALAWVVALAAAYAGVGDTARSVARELARGTPVAQAVAEARAEAADTTVAVTTVGAVVAVDATREIAPPLPFLSGATVTLHQRIVVPREWS